MQTDLVDWLLSTYGQEQMRPGLDRIRRAVSPLFSRFQKTKIVIIAGTNGKGETTLRLSKKLSAHHHFVWTSPHISRITERFRNEKGEIDPKKLEALIQQCHEEVLREKFELSFYEFLFLVFCTWAAESEPEFLLLEVGLGGRLDAVNIFDAEVVLLPSISRDHQEILGNRYDKILGEKLGTLRANSQLLHFLDLDYLCERAKRISDSVGARCFALKEKCQIPSFAFSLRNEVLAGAAYDYLMKNSLTLSGPQNLTGLEHRGELFRGENEVVFFGSHNVDGLRKLIQFLHSETYTFSRVPFDQIIVAFSRRSREDLRVMLKMLKRASLGPVVVTSFLHPKAAERDLMESLSREEGIEFAFDIQAHLQARHESGRYLVTGSYYFLGYFKSLSCCR